MKILALIPARSGSKRVIDKNIRELGGVPLMAWSIRSAIKCELINGTFVSTDSDKYIGIANDFGSNSFIRSEGLSGDECGDREVVIDFLSKQPCHLVVYFRPTTPFRDTAVITRAIDEFIKSDNDSMRSVEEMGESAYKCFTVSGDGELEPVWYQQGEHWSFLDLTDKPNQECPKTYHPNGYIDILRSEVILRGGSIWGEKKMAFVTERAIEIDTEYDFWLAEQWLKRGKE